MERISTLTPMCELVPDATIIIPVYRNKKLTIACISRAIVDIEKRGAKLIVVNDAPKDKQLRTLISEMRCGKEQWFSLINNDQNIGFVKSVNKAIKQSSKCDVIILNSDVLVPTGWLEKLQIEAYSIPGVGTVTPLSNNSTISSIPHANKGTKIFQKYDVDDINSSFSKRLNNIASPTGIGFCMYIKRDCLERVGLLNEDKFGKGYGEENDFCQRAIKSGFINLITPNIYCHHVGGVSFGKSSLKRSERACRIIERMHPNYHADVRDWIQRDPLAPARVIRNIEIYSLLGFRFVLHITHSLGGGTAKHIRSLIDQSEIKTICIELRGKRNSNAAYELIFNWQKTGGKESFLISSETDMIDLLASLPIGAAHIHSIIGIAQNIILSLTKRLRIKYIMTHHDYYILYRNPFYLPQRSNKNSKLISKRYENISFEHSEMSFSEWDLFAKSLLNNSSLNIYPSRDTLTRYEKYTQSLPTDIIVPHETITNPNIVSNLGWNSFAKGLKGREIRLLSLGAISVEKGADVLEAMACKSASGKIGGCRLSFHIIGYAYRKLRDVSESGPYDNSELLKLIMLEDGDAILFTPLCAETYSYTLTTAMMSRLPIIAPRLGSFEERLRDYSNYYLYDIYDDLDTLLRNISHYLQENMVKADMYRADFVELNHYYTGEYHQVLDSICKAADLNDIDIAYHTLSNCKSAKDLAWQRNALKIIMALSRVTIVSYFIRLIPFKYQRRLKEWIYPRPLLNSGLL